MDWIGILDTELRIFGALKNFVILLWFGYWGYRFARDWRAGHNSLTLALALFFVAVADERLWSMTMGIYTASPYMTEVRTVLMLVWRELSLWLTLASLIFLQWKFTSNDENNS